MARARIGLVVASLMLGMATVGVPSAAASGPDDQPAEVVASVRVATTTSPVAGACVTLTSTTDASTYSGCTTQNGDVPIYDVPAGAYIVSMVAPGYHDMWLGPTGQSMQYLASGAAPYVVQSGQLAFLPRFDVTSAPVLTGVIKDSVTHVRVDGQPFCVKLIEAAQELGYSCSTAGSPSVGTYAFRGVVVGHTYALAYFPNTNTDNNFHGGAAGDYGPQWFPGGVTDRADATTITAAAGVNQNDFDVQKGAALSGAVTTSDGAAMPSGVCVQAYATDDREYAATPYDTGNPEGVVAETCDLAGGTYTIRGLPTGSFLVRFDGGPTHIVSQSAVSPVSLTAPSPASGPDAVLAVGGIILGSAQSLSHGTLFDIPNEQVYVYDQTTDTSANKVIATGIETEPGHFAFYGLPVGTYYLRYVQTYNGAQQWSSQADAAHAAPLTLSAGTTLNVTEKWDDALPTTSTTAPTTPGTIATRVTAAWSGADQGLGVRDFDVRYQRAPWNSAFGTAAFLLKATQARSTTLALGPGYTYCVSTRARDKAGNIGAWSAPKCTALALDDRSLSASAHWTRSTASGYYGGTYTASTTLGATLARTGALTKRLGIVATTCARCGTVGVYVGSTLIGKVSLVSSTTQRHHLLMLPPFSYRSGTVVLKVLTSGKTVQIDGLVTSRA